VAPCQLTLIHQQQHYSVAAAAATGRSEAVGSSASKAHKAQILLLHAAMTCRLAGRWCSQQLLRQGPVALLLLLTMCMDLCQGSSSKRNKQVTQSAMPVSWTYCRHRLLLLLLLVPTRGPAVQQLRSAAVQRQQQQLQEMVTATQIPGDLLLLLLLLQQQPLSACQH
jgi:hypothetical protein